MPDRHYLWQAEQRAARIDLLDEMAALDPRLVVPGHRLPDIPADASALSATREYLTAFEEELGKAGDGAVRFPDA